MKKRKLLKELVKVSNKLEEVLVALADDVLGSEWDDEEVEEELVELEDHEDERPE